jgi:hypothetical protein
VASQLITQHQLDDTFYVVDLANVVRLFKVWELVWYRLRAAAAGKASQQGNVANNNN